MFKTFDTDRKIIETKYHWPDQPFNPYKRMAYHGYDYDETTGLSDGEIRELLLALDPQISHLPHPVAKAKAVALVLENTRIDVNEHDYFVGIYSWNRLADCVTLTKWKNEVFSGELADVDALMKDMNASGAVSIWPDFDHVVPDWDSLLRLGFPGLRQRARDYRAKLGTLTPRQEAFFDGIELEYTAVIAFLDRLYQLALRCGHSRGPVYAACLKQLRDGAPTNTYEALQLMYLYFMISESVDHYQVRSLGNGLDHSLRPFYEADLKNGTYTRDEIKELLAYFFMQWQAIGNYWGQPLYLGGSNADGTCRVCDLSYDILEVYRRLGLYNPKIQIKYNQNTPLKFLNEVLDMIRSGQSSFVFCCEKGMGQAIMRYGATAEEARQFDIRGCYETGVRANEVSTITGYVNPLKAVLYALFDGFDSYLGKQIGLHTGPVETFDQFYAAFLKQYAHLIDLTFQCADRYEKYMEHINPSSLYSATIVSSLEKGADAYQDGAKFSNSAVLNCGLATAVDAVLGVWELVENKKLATMAELRQALDVNWEGYERLRAHVLRSPHKYGCSDPLADRYAMAISAYFTERVSGRKNARGGVYKASAHSAMQFVWQGQKTPATPDGRRAGDEISKNASPTPGMDREGVTALVRSNLKLNPYTYSESFCLDVMLHPTVTAGDEGLIAMKAVLDAYEQGGGMAIQFNVFDLQTLRDAQKHPEKYRSLQVRVCGWNVLWNNLSRPEQDAYIERAEKSLHE